LYVKVAVPLVFKCLKLESQVFDFILFEGDIFVIVHALELPFGQENAVLKLIELHLLLLNVQPPLPHQLILLVDPGETYPVGLFFSFVPLNDLVELLGQLVNLRLQFDVLLDQSLFLVLPREEFLQCIVGLLLLFLVFVLWLFRLEPLLRHELVWLRGLFPILLIKVNLQAPVNDLDCQLILIH
jgi:hypothetical protein